MIEQTESDGCRHPKIASWYGILDDTHNYQCMGCGQAVVVPFVTWSTAGIDGEAAILGTVYGGTWRAKMSNEQEYGRRWSVGKHHL